MFQGGRTGLPRAVYHLQYNCSLHLIYTVYTLVRNPYVAENNLVLCANRRSRRGNLLRSRYNNRRFCSSGTMNVHAVYFSLAIITAIKMYNNVGETNSFCARTDLNLNVFYFLTFCSVVVLTEE